MNEHDCIDMKCTHYDGDMCTLGFCEPGVLEEDSSSTFELSKELKEKMWKGEHLTPFAKEQMEKNNPYRWRGSTA